MTAKSGRVPDRGCSPRHLTNRRDFLRRAGSMGVGLGLGPAAAINLRGRAEAAAMAGSAAVQAGKAQHVTILHTTDMHAQLDIHDEFFYEDRAPRLQAAGRVCHACAR